MQALTARCQWSTAVGGLLALVVVFIAGAWISRHPILSVVELEDISTSTTGTQGHLTRLFGAASCKNTQDCYDGGAREEEDGLGTGKHGTSAVEKDGPAAVKEYWEDAACQEFYGPLGNKYSSSSSVSSLNLKSVEDTLGELSEQEKQHQKQERTRLPVPMVSEDFYKNGGRRKAMKPNHVANEVVISNTYKFIYVENRKGASSTIREALRKYFNITWSGPTCPHIESYFFFSFVRDPVDRFVSGYKQAWHHRFKNQGIEIGKTSHMNWVLDKILKEHYHTDEHLETQAMSLGTRWLDRDGITYRIPMDFIGRVENLENDFKRVMDKIQQRSSTPLPKGLMLAHENQGGKVALATRQVLDSALREKVLSSYAQDRVCFGY